MIRAHANAVLALAQAGAVTVYDTAAPALPAYPYAVLRFDSGRRVRSALTAVSDTLTETVTCTSVGLDRVQSQWVAEKVTALLLDVRPVVAGRTCAPLEHLDTQPSRRDDDVAPPLFYAVDLFRFISVPA